MSVVTTSEAAGATLRFLPPYSPDLNPIEQLFAKLKAMLRKANCRTIDGFWAAVGDVVQSVPPRECAGWFCQRSSLPASYMLRLRSLPFKQIPKYRARWLFGACGESAV